MQDSMKIKIINYQNIRKADLEFVPGLNCIVGSSNNGKSACYRALETAIFNLARESHITIGEDQSMVGIKYNDHEVIWRRDKKASSQVTYRVDGNIYSKVGRGQLDLVASSLNIKEIDLNGKKFRVNFGKQMSYPFLLDSTPSEFFKFIVQSDDEDVTKVLDTMKKDFTEMKSNVKAYETTCNSLESAYRKEAAEYKSLLPKLDYAKQVIDLDWKVEEYKKLLSDIDTLKKAIDTTSNMGVVLTRTKEKYDYLNEVVTNLLMCRRMCDDLESGIDKFDVNTGVAESCTRDLLSYEKFNKLVEGLNEERNNLNRAMVTESKYNSIKSMMAQAEHYHNIIEVESGRIELMKKSNEELEEVYSYVESHIDLVKDMERVVSNLRRDTLEVFRINKAKEDLEGRIRATERIIKETEEELSKFGVCPHCGSKLNNEHVHQEELI